MRPEGSRGFTLIEVLLALSLYGLVMLLILPTFRGGLAIWEREEKRDLATPAVGLFLTQFAQELENTVSLRAAPFLGEEEEMTFNAVTSEYAEGKRVPRLSRIHYWFSSGVLFRAERELGKMMQERRQFDEDEPSDSNRWMERLEGIFFEYASVVKKKIEWRKEWQADPEKGGLPLGIRIRLLGEKGATPVQKIIFLPDGVRQEHEIS